MNVVTRLITGPLTCIVDIQPSQLFLKAEKLKAIQRQDIEGKEMPPIPVWWHDGRLVALDGHTRLYYRFTLGYETIPAYHEDDFNMETYVVALEWCRDAGITSIKDVSTRILDREFYTRAWIDKCSRDLLPTG